ncbi:hypothetical protein D3C76_1124330 [compost metagenome]
MLRNVAVTVIYRCRSGIHIACAIFQLNGRFTKQCNHRLHYIRIKCNDYFSCHFFSLIACGIADIIMEGINISFRCIESSQAVYFTANCCCYTVCNITILVIISSRSCICIFRTDVQIHYCIT